MTRTLECCHVSAPHFPRASWGGHTEREGWVGPREKNKMGSVTVTSVLQGHLTLISKSLLGRKNATQSSGLPQFLLCSRTRGRKMSLKKCSSVVLAVWGPKKESTCVYLEGYKRFRWLRGRSGGRGLVIFLPYLIPAGWWPQEPGAAAC